MTDVPEHRKPWAIYANVLPDFWNREKVPSVSQIIAFKYGGPPEIPSIQIAMDRGSKIHRALEFFDEGDLHLPSIKGSEIELYLNEWQQWIHPDDGFLMIERPLYGVLCDIPFLVRPDRVLRRDDRIYVVDIKTKSKQGRPPNDKERLQHGLAAAAQTVAVQQRSPYLAVNWQGCVYVWPDRPCQMVGYNDPKLIDEFAKILVEWRGAQEVKHEEEGRPSREEDLAPHA